VFYAVVVLVSALFLFVGNRVAAAGRVGLADGYAPVYHTAVVTQVVERVELFHEIGPDFGFTNVYVFFTARLGENVVVAEQSVSDFVASVEREVAVGDHVLLVYDEFLGHYVFTGYVRVNYIMWLGAVFFALVVAFGRAKGLRAIVSLGFTCIAIFWVFVPAILSGRNVYAVTLVICAYAVVSTMLMVLGPNRRALGSMLACAGGVAAAGALMALMGHVLNLTGVPNQEAQMLLFLPLEHTPDLRALIFAGVVLGAAGVIMDAAMSIASSMWEVRQAGVSGFRALFSSGLNVGRDVLGANLNTFILAYIGSSLSLVLIVLATSASATELFNSEMIAVELLRALVGSLGMLLTIPLTAAVCGRLYVSSGDEHGNRDTAEYYYDEHFGYIKKEE